jgi:hypothetical protein
MSQPLIFGRVFLFLEKWEKNNNKIPPPGGRGDLVRGKRGEVRYSYYSVIIIW